MPEVPSSLYSSNLVFTSSFDVYQVGRTTKTILNQLKPKQVISDTASQFKVVKSTVEEAWQLSTKSPGT